MQSSYFSYKAKDILKKLYSFVFRAGFEVVIRAAKAYKKNLNIVFLSHVALLCDSKKQFSEPFSPLFRFQSTTSKHALMPLLILLPLFSIAQVDPNDGFGGRSWYKPAIAFAGNGQRASFGVVKGQLYQWGHISPFDNTLLIPNGSLVYPAASNAYVSPQPVIGFDDVTAISMNRNLAGMINNGNAYIWGTLNFRDPAINLTVGESLQFTGMKDISANDLNVTMVRNDGRVFSVGYNYNGQFGNGTKSSTWTSTPVQMNSITNAVRVITKSVQVVGGTDVLTLILSNNGQVWVAGDAPEYGATNASGAPRRITALSNIVAIQLGRYAAYALDQNGDVWSWGTNWQGAMGNNNSNVNTITAYPTPVQVAFPGAAAPIVAIFSDAHEGCFALDENQDLWYWGGGGKSGILRNVSRRPYRTASEVIDMMSGNYDGVADGTSLSYMMHHPTYCTDQFWVVGRDEANSGYIFNRDIGDDSSEHIRNWTRIFPDLEGLPASEGNEALYPVGTANCGDISILGDIVPGTPSEVAMRIPLNITTAGVGQFTITGSDFSVNPSPYIIDLPNTGQQDVYITLQYDGSSLGTSNFEIGGVLSCSMNLAGESPQPIIVPVTTLSTCTPITPSTLSKP